MTNHWVETPVSSSLLGKISKIVGKCDFVHGPVIAGGAARRDWCGQDVANGDIDIFFTNMQSFEKTTQKLRSLYTAQHDKRLSNLFPFGYKLDTAKLHSYNTHNAATFDLFVWSGIPLLSKPLLVRFQCIKKYFFDDIDSLVNRFDFTVCQFLTDGKLILASPQAVEDSKNRILRHIAGTPLSNMRVLKYCLYGYNPEAQIIMDILRSRHETRLICQSDDDYDNI